MTSKAARLTISITLYQDDPAHLSQLLESISKSKLRTETYFFDNTKTGKWRALLPKAEGYYYRTQAKNLSYGKGHNAVIHETLSEGDYHLVVNPDVYFDTGLLEVLVALMDENPKTGLVQPGILNPNGSDQRQFKLLPKPMDLLSRRFPDSFQRFFKRSRSRYEMHFKQADDTFEVPVLSGCFMFIRKEALRQVGGFDPRFFLYCEDIDLCRRIGREWQTLYYGKLHIYHHFRKSSYAELRFFYYHVVSAIKYFNKYGWWFDKERERINYAILSSKKHAF